MSRRALAGVMMALAAGCANAQLPSRPGRPVPLSHVENYEASEAFLATLSARRRADGLADAIVVAQLQSGMREVAEKLQGGKLSAVEALLTAKDYGDRVAGHSVDAWILDCTTAQSLDLPRGLVREETVSISYAIAHFSMPEDDSRRCGVVVVRLP